MARTGARDGWHAMLLHWPKTWHWTVLLVVSALSIVDVDVTDTAVANDVADAIRAASGTVWAVFDWLLVERFEVFAPLPMEEPADDPGA